ncbi:poly-gamma-glutamate hydrolase family protein [Bacillus licheniformis]|nr:poly-gamma-glutamate hydrolase family protein [Bacillus licheniformis]
MAAGHRYILAFHGYEEPAHRHTLIGGTDRRRALMFKETLERHGFLRSWRLKGAIFQVQTLQASTIAAKPV